MTTTQLKPEDVFAPQDLPQYELQFNRLWFHLANAHDSAYVVERIRAFPFHLFASPDRERFFTLVLFNFTRQVALTVINTLTDGTRGAHTFQTLQDWLPPSPVQRQLGVLVIPSIQEIGGRE
jgi:hypothetical protein